MVPHTPLTQLLSQGSPSQSVSLLTRARASREIDGAKFDLYSKAQYYMGMYRAPFNYRPQVVVDQFNILHHLFLLGDLFDEFGPPRALDVIRLEMPLIFREWISFRICTYTAAYPAGARTLRWIYESSLLSTIAVVRSSLLGNSSGKPLSPTKFRKWLWKYDHQQANYSKKSGLAAIGLSQQEQTRCLKLYSTLCKFSHLSERIIVRPGWLPDLQLELQKFDSISRLAYMTADLALYSIISATTHHWTITDFWKGYLDYFSERSYFGVDKRKLPLAYHLVKTNT